MFDHAFRVLVGFDSSSASEEALRLALDQASEHPLSQVHVVRVLPQMTGAMMPGVIPGATLGHMGLDSDFIRADEDPHSAHMDLRHDVTRIFHSWAHIQQNWIEKVEVHTRFDEPVRGILNLADELDVNLVVVGTRARGGIHRLLFGSVAEKVMRHSTRPVLVAHSHESATVAPTIEPTCPACTQTRFETKGGELWCTRHREHHAFGRPLHHTSRPLQPDVRTL
jgi:nucleotide-binding universal stress UspA family protein